MEFESIKAFWCRHKKNTREIPLRFDLKWQQSHGCRLWPVVYADSSGVFCAEAIRRASLISSAVRAMEYIAGMAKKRAMKLR